MKQARQRRRRVLDVGSGCAELFDFRSPDGSCPLSASVHKFVDIPTDCSHALNQDWCLCTCQQVAVTYPVYGHVGRRAPVSTHQVGRMHERLQLICNFGVPVQDNEDSATLCIYAEQIALIEYIIRYTGEVSICIAVSLADIRLLEVLSSP
jgi:hypothetical protein